MLWTHLTVTSGLHVFLPLQDMGIDGVLRRPGTDIATAIQVKSRHPLRDGKLHLLIRDDELRDPHAFIVAVVLEVGGVELHPLAICIDVLAFRELGFRRTGADVGSQASIPFPPPATSCWHPYVMPIPELAERLCPPDPLPAVPIAASPVGRHARQAGYRAEMRLLALLAADARLNTFKAFPDLELVEYCVRHVTTGAIAGIQVKSISVDPAHPSGEIGVPRHTFRPTPCTYIVALAERRGTGELHESALLIPSMDLGDVLYDHGDKLSLHWDPDSTRADAATAPYRCPTAELAPRIAQLLGDAPLHSSR